MAYILYNALFVTNLVKYFALSPFTTIATLWRRYCQFWSIASSQWQVWLLESGAKNKTFLQWKKFKTVNLTKLSRYLTMEWWDKSDLLTENGVPSLGTVLHCRCHPDVAYYTFPRVIFPTYAPVISNKALRFTRTNSLSCFTPRCLQELCPRLCLHNSLELVSDTPLQSVPLEPHTSGTTVEICYLTRIWQQNHNAKTLLEQRKSPLVDMQ